MTTSAASSSSVNSWRSTAENSDNWRWNAWFETS